MADKYRQIKLSDYVGTFTTPREAFEFFKTYVSLVRGDWLEVREKIMKRALRAKFGQNVELGKLLLSTGEARLVEHTVNDRYWGDGGGDNRGRNRLGALLMEVREELANFRGERLRWNPTDVIKFYNRGEPYYEFTNFYNAKIRVEGKPWPNTEVYFQALKGVKKTVADLLEHENVRGRPEVIRAIKARADRVPQAYYMPVRR